MSGRSVFNDLTKGFTPERRARVDANKGGASRGHGASRAPQGTGIDAEIYRRSIERQPAVAKLERRTDMYVSNLRAYIEALGGKLSIVAQFPQGDVAITNFSDAAE